MEPVRLTFTPTPGDYRRVVFRLTLRRMRVTFIILAIVSAVFVGLTLSEALRGDSASSSALPTTLCLYVPFVLFTVLTLLVGPLSIGQQASRDESLCAETTYEFGNRDAVVKNTFTTTRERWDKFGKVLLTNEHYILMLADNKNIGRFIPRRAFESPEQETAFRELLARKLDFKG